MKRFIVGIIGQGEDASPVDQNLAELAGELIAKENWVVLTGGRDSGVMRAASKGAKKVQGSLTIGILPNKRAVPSPHIDIAIITDMNEARNNINVLSSDVILACGRAGPGTASEIALAVKAGKTVLLLGGTETGERFFTELAAQKVIKIKSPEEAIEAIKRMKGQL
jgi:uncharacterized protein (TIGR00725 family)